MAESKFINIDDFSEQTSQILRSTSFSDPEIKNSTKQTKMDALCELTTKITKRPANYDMPAPDYEGAFDYNSNGYLSPVENISGDKEFLTAAFIRKNMSSQMKDISKDIQMRSKQDTQKRPEFLSKQHQMKSVALRKQEEKKKEESNELFAKLKSRAQQIKQVEEQNQEEENKPEFMKIKLKPKHPAAVQS